MLDDPTCSIFDFQKTMRCNRTYVESCPIEMYENVSTISPTERAVALISSGVLSRMFVRVSIYLRDICSIWLEWLLKSHADFRMRTTNGLVLSWKLRRISHLFKQRIPFHVHAIACPCLAVSRDACAQVLEHIRLAVSSYRACNGTQWE